MKQVVEKLKEGLKDPNYRQGWISNIAMAQFDSEQKYRKQNNKVGKYLNQSDRIAIANKSAESFINLLVKS